MEEAGRACVKGEASNIPARGMDSQFVVSSRAPLNLIWQEMVAEEFEGEAKKQMRENYINSEGFIHVGYYPVSSRLVFPRYLVLLVPHGESVYKEG